MKEQIEIAVLIPCYNEEQTIKKVINDFQKELPESSIYVCDNNSNDRTFTIAKEAGATVFKEYKKGKANAVLTCFKNIKADFYLMVDGDDTYPAEYAKQMIEDMKTYNLDMLIGDRISNGTYKEENKRMLHNFGNRLIKELINKIFSAKLEDILSGYRVFSKSFVKNYATLAQGFELETDLSIFALNYNLSIKETPINYRDRPEGSFSKLNTFKDGLKVIKTFFNLYRFYKPLSFFTLLSAIIFLISLVIGSFPIYEYLKFSYIYKVPSAILAISLTIISILIFTCGIVLDTIMKIDKKNTQLKIRNN